MSLDEAKQQRILDAAYEEFARHGYDNASTNNIVKEAGIGKGMLFYYFNSKKELFDYLIENGTKFVMKEYLDKIYDGQSDFIDKYAQAAMVKKAAYMKKPSVFNFLAAIYLSKGEVKISDHLEKQLNYVRDLGYKKLYENIDTSLFREDVKPEEIIKLIQWSLDGYEKNLICELDGQNLEDINMEPYWEDFDKFLGVLKTIYYK